MPLRCLLLLLLFVTACDATDSSTTGAGDATSDASAPDAGANACDVPLIAAGDLTLARCADGARYALRRGAGPPLLIATAAARIAGTRLVAADWPQATWLQPAPDHATARFTGLEDAPDLELSLRLGPDALRLTVALESRPELPPLPVDALWPLDAPDGGALLRPAAGEPPRALSAGALAPVPIDEAGARRDEQLLGGTATSAAIGALTVDAATLRIELGADRLEARTVDPPTSLPSGGRLDGPTVEVRLGANPLDLQADRAAAVLAGLPDASPRPCETGWGWRSAPAYGALVNAAVLDAEAAALRALAAERGVDGAGWILADGLWYAAPGDWRGGEGFPDGLGAASAALGTHGMRLGLRWPALRGADGALDPSLPAVREQLGRALATLRDAGVGLVVLEPLSAENRDAYSLRETLAALREGGGADVALVVPDAVVWPTLGHADAAIVGPRVESALGRTCDTLDRPGQCRAKLLDLKPADAAPPAEPEPLEARAAALAGRWHYGHGLIAAEPGAVRVGADQPAGRARQAVALAALAGGLYWLADSPVALDAARADLYFAPLRHGLPTCAAARPLDLFDSGDAPPSIWHAPGRALALFNWTDAPRTFERPAALAPALGEVIRLFDAAPRAPLAGVERVTVPPRDVAVFVADPIP